MLHTFSSYKKFLKFIVINLYEHFSFHLLYSRYIMQIAYTLQHKYLMLSVQDGINVQGGIFHKINKNTGPNKCVQGGIFSKN